MYPLKSLLSSNKQFLATILVVFLSILPLSLAKAQNSDDLLVLKSAGIVAPFDEVIVSCKGEGILKVYDGKGREYVKSQVSERIAFVAGGAAGTQKISLFDKKGKQLATTTFILKAATSLEDGGKFNELFTMCLNGMLASGSNGIDDFMWNGKSYKFYVSWDLDNSNVMNGLQYFLPYGYGLTDLLRETQREDGMIWSFVRNSKSEYQYYETAYGPINFFKWINDGWFVRQPVDNHSDYCYVNMFYKHWKASGDIEWMKKTLPSAALALDYCYTDSIRWSDKFQLLKRPYCIDSWDFQVMDEYTPEANISPTMVVVPGNTKYGIFFGDNTGYFEACNQLAEMYEFIGESSRAKLYRERGEMILKNLTELAWNGNFFTHYIDEDPSVIRKLGVDEKSQIAQSNMYSVNRGIPHEMNVEIIKTYQKLKENLPVGSPGEWYAIYPPFERGFGTHGGKWQYMNGGVAGHAIGELARGAYESGFEEYASDILIRLYELGKKYNNKIYFSYTGSIPPPPAPPVFKPVDISAVANMDIMDTGGKNVFKWMNDSKPGNDMRGLPTGIQKFKNIDFIVLDPFKTGRRVAVAVSTNKEFPAKAEVVVNDTAGSVYILHSSSGGGSAKIAGALTFVYDDGSISSKYIMRDKDVCNWWFPSLNTNHSGVAWSGPNLVSTEVGVCWAVVDNPYPGKRIEKISFDAPLEGGIYAVLALTLADKPNYIKPAGESFGGPDNWAAGNGMAALIEGLAGVKNISQSYENVKLSPRWTSAGVDSVSITANLAASGAYVSYNYLNNPESGEISLQVTGSGKDLIAHVLLPAKATVINSVLVNNKAIEFNMSTVEGSKYADFNIAFNGIQNIRIKYN